jgi:hypothetical protein
MTEPLQNDPDRAGNTLVPDAIGEFVEDSPGGAFDPRSFREGDAGHADPGPHPAPAGGTGDRVDVPTEQGATAGPGDEGDKLGHR